MAAESSKFAAQMLESGVKLFYYNVCTASPLELILCMFFFCFEYLYASGPRILRQFHCIGSLNCCSLLELRAGMCMLFFLCLRARAHQFRYCLGYTYTFTDEYKMCVCFD